MADFSNSNVDSVILAGRDNTVDQEDEESSDVRFIVVGQTCKDNEDLQEALKIIAMPVLYSDTAQEYMSDTGDYDTVFVLSALSGDVFNRLHRAGARIVGPPVIIRCALNNQHLPNNTRPLYSTTMRHLVICFTGIRVKEELSTLADLVHHMGGSIRKDFSTRVTHLVANCTTGEKYRAAVSFGTYIMKEEWVHKCWEDCRDSDTLATDPDLMEYKMSPFSLLTISFLGFSRAEELHMEELTVRNGGTYAESGAPTSTHLVVDETTVKNIPFDVHHKLHVVKTEWFWASIQMDACADEAMYRFEEPVPAGTPTTRSNCNTPKTLSGGKSRKRKRLRDNLRELAADTDNTESPMFTTRRGNELARMSLSASFLEVTDPSIKSPDSPCQSDGSTTPLSADISKMTPRQLTVMELLQTEKNYVGILHAILKVFKEEIERPDQPGGPLLVATDIKIIFGGVGPMAEVHVGIRDELQHAVNNWHNDQRIGQIFLNHAEALLKAYPPFVNFFENTKETITTCDRTKPRFHAFLKLCQSRPECGRQTLSELLIRPVQRLPSVMLLLKEIQKRTERSQADYTQLSEAILKLEEVMTHINEDKRKTDGHQQMFDIINDIDNCPPNLLSSHRNFVLKVDVVEVTDTLSGKGDNLSLFLFTDSLEMCKRRTKVLNAKSPAVAHAPKTPQKAYKHLEMMQLSCIKKVVNITEAPECKGVMALVTKELNKKEKLYAFMLVEEDTDKNDLLRTLSKHISNTTCRADFRTVLVEQTKVQFENLMLSMDASSLHLDVVDLQQRTLGKVATKFGKRVSRAFSFNKTPRKLKRAMSSMSQVMSPFHRDSMGGFVNPNNPQTPSNLRGMRLASTNDLTPQEEEEETFYSTLIDSHSAFGNHSFATPKKRRETLANCRLPSVAMPPPGGVSSPHMSSLSHAASCMTLHRVDLDPKVKAIRVSRRKSVAWRDASSPLFATPSTNLTLQFTKSATIGHTAGKLL